MAVFTKDQQAQVDRAIQKAIAEGYAKAIAEGKGKASGVGVKSNGGLTRANAQAALTKTLALLPPTKWASYGPDKSVGACGKLVVDGVTLQVGIAVANSKGVK